MKEYGLMLLDDEEFVLESIKKVFDFKEYGFTLKGAYSRPLRALEDLPSLRPDLIVTDIRMPIMSGIEFTEKVKEILPDTEIVLLSGYDDFSYAQTAVRLGVSDYLLKPIKKDDFIAMLEAMYDKIDKRRHDEESVLSLRQQIEVSQSERKADFFLQLAENENVNRKRMEQTCKQLGLEVMDRYFVLVKFYFSGMEFQQDMMSEVGKLSVDIESTLSEYGRIESFLSDESAFIFLYYDTPGLHDTVSKSIKEYNLKKRSEGSALLAGISSEHFGIWELFTANQECNQMIWSTGTAASDSISNLQEVLDHDLTIPYEKMEALFRAVTDGDKDAIAQAASDIYRFPERLGHRLALQYSYSISFLLLLRLYQIKTKYEINEHVIPVELLELKNLRYQYPTIAEQESMIGEFSETISELIEVKGTPAPSQIVKAAIENIEKHYRENISLSSVAREIGISKNYLCDIFKKETGMTFLNYVTNIRIEEAKKLLKRPELKMYEIGEAVGFHDYTYFSQIFKKRTGQTLSAFRRGI